MKRMFAVAGLLLMASPAFSQGAAEVEAEKLYDDLIITPIVPQRDKAQIRADMDAAEKDLKRTEQAIGEAQKRGKEAEGWMAAQKSHIDALKKQIKAAKKEKREADLVNIEAQKKQLDLVQGYLKQTREVRSVELALAKSQKELANARKKVYQSEFAGNKMVEAIRSGEPSDPGFSKSVVDAAQAGEKTLNLMQEMAKKSATTADKMNQLAKRRVTLVETRNKLLSEDRIRKAADKLGQ